MILSSMGHMLHTFYPSNRQIQTPPSSGQNKDAVKKKKKSAEQGFQAAGLIKHSKTCQGLTVPTSVGLFSIKNIFLSCL